jgi:serine protease
VKVRGSIRLGLAAVALGLVVVLLAAVAWGGQAGGPVTADELDETAYDIEDELVVDFEDDVEQSEITKLLASLAVRSLPTTLADETKTFVARAAPGQRDRVLAALLADERIELVEPHARVRALFEPNDPLLDEQWHLERVGAGRAWDFSTGRGVTVAVVDTGIACEDFGPFNKASDLNQTRCVAGYNLVLRSSHASDDHGHGTHVAGTIAQSTHNGLGAAGLAFDARLMPVKVLSADGWGTTTDVADGIRWAADHGAQVINLSLGGPRNSRLLERAVAYARERAVVVVAAAGNSGGRVHYPGGTAGVFGVSATDQHDALAWFSSRGPGVDLAAPGVNVVQQTICNGGRDHCERFPSFSGTSMASPHVAAAAALLVSLGVTHPPAVERLLSSSARQVDDSPRGHAFFGAGILQAERATLRAALLAVVARVLMLALVLLWVFRWNRRSGERASPWTPGFLIAAFATGPGLLFFAPFVLPRHFDVVDLLARPLGDWDLLLNASWHRFLPFAHVGVPLAFTVLLLGVRRLTPALAGLSAGTAAYLLSVAVLGQAAAPFGRVLLIAWCIINAFACVYLARLLLSERARELG